MVGKDWGVPVGFDAGATDDDGAVVTAVVVGWGSPPGVLLVGPPIRARRVVMMSLIIAKRLEPEPEPAGASDYKIQSGNHALVKTPAHTHRIPAIPRFASLKYRSLRSNRRSIRHGCKKKSESRRHVVWRRNALEKRAKRTKKRVVKAVQRILWKD